MEKLEVVCYRDGHYCQNIYSLGPYIADYPEQVLLACIVQEWCPWCVNFTFVDDDFSFKIHINVMHIGVIWMTAILDATPMNLLKCFSR